MVDAKKQQFRSSPSGPIGGRKISGTIGGKGTTIGKNASHDITVDATVIPAIAGLKVTDMVLVQPTATFGGDANAGVVGAAPSGANTLNVRIMNPTGVDITDYTLPVEIIIFPFNIA